MLKRPAIGSHVSASPNRRRAKAAAAAVLALSLVFVDVVANGPPVRAATPELILGRPLAGEYQPVMGDG